MSTVKDGNYFVLLVYLTFLSNTRDCGLKFKLLIRYRYRLDSILMVRFSIVLLRKYFSPKC